MTTNARKQQLEAMLKEFPEDAFLHYGLAMEHVSAGDDEGALRGFEALARLDPSYVPAYLQAGQACVRLGRIEQARSTFQAGMAAAEKARDLHALEEMRGFLASLVD